MKRYKHLFGQFCSFDNLFLAAKKASRGKRFRSDVLVFNDRLETNLLKLRDELLSGEYEPGAYTPFWIIDKGKKRFISRAPFKDRVIHHALNNVIEPLFEPTFITDCYANRSGKGTHKALDRAQTFCARNRYVLKCDIAKYFASIDHELLKRAIRKKIADSKILKLIDLIIDSSNEQEPVYWIFPGDDLITPIERRKGIPIGNLTSQFFANLYLNGFDHYVKESLHCRYYLRYVDDFLCVDDNKERLFEIKERMSDYLGSLRLVLHPKKSRVFPTRIGVPFLGYRIYPTHRRLSKKNSMAFRKRLKIFQSEYRTGQKSLADITISVRSWIAHASHADTYRLRNSILSSATFTKG